MNPPAASNFQETTMDPMKNFEIPSDMRKLAEQSVEQARQAFGGFINAAQQAVNDMEGRASTARAGAKDVSEKAVSFAQRNIMASFEFAQKLVQARDVQEMMKLQTEYIQTQMKALSEQAKELGQSASKAMESAKPKF
jgi:phasin